MPVLSECKEKWQLNHSDPRVRRRVELAVTFAASFLSDTKPRATSKKLLDEYFGQQQHPLSKYLRNRLLICTREAYSAEHGICKYYIYNRQQLIELCDLLDPVTPHFITCNTLVYKKLTEKFSTELALHHYKYKDASNRLWHPLQNVRREYKHHLFQQHGMRYKYDIVCCAPRLIYQYSTQLPLQINDGKWVSGPYDEYPFALREYLNDRQSVRTRLSSELNIPLPVIKVILNALLFGAPLAQSKHSSVFALLNCDHNKMNELRTHPWITTYRSDIRSMWSYIRPYMTQKWITTRRNHRRRLPISAKQRAALYFDIERQVIDSVRSYLDNNQICYFLEHDGWYTNQHINITDLIHWITSRTNYVIEVDQTQL